MLLRILALACRLLPLALCNFQLDSGLEDVDGLYPVTGDEVVQEGGMVTLRCTVQENDNSSLQWSNPTQQTLYFDEKKALRDNRISLVYYSRHELTISISNMTLRDEGDYTCSIFTMPVRTTVAKVVVLAAPKKPEISGYIGPIAEGRTITLMCNTSGSKPLATIRWFKGSEEMEGHYTYESDPADQRAYALSNVVNLTVWRDDNGAVIECAVNHRALRHNVYTAQQKIEVHSTGHLCELEECVLHVYMQCVGLQPLFGYLKRLLLAVCLHISPTFFIVGHPV
ncbi:cell adhesion molecule 2-like [Rhinoraja longicauda]